MDLKRIDLSRCGPQCDPIQRHSQQPHQHTVTQSSTRIQELLLLQNVAVHITSEAGTVFFKGCILQSHKLMHKDMQEVTAKQVAGLPYPSTRFCTCLEL
jgi:hypothetical protein